MQFDRGFVSAYMFTDVDKIEAVLNDPYILITDNKISNIQEAVFRFWFIVKGEYLTIFYSPTLFPDLITFPNHFPGITWEKKYHFF